MIKLKSIIFEENENDVWRKDWLKRYRAKFDDKGRLIAYHGTTRKNARLIKQSGFRPHSYFSLDPNYSRSIASTYHDVPEDKVVVFEVHLPLDAVDFVASDIFSTRLIKFEEVI